MFQGFNEHRAALGHYRCLPCFCEVHLYVRDHGMKFILVRASFPKQNTLDVRHGICQCNILSDTIRIVSLVALDLSEVINLWKGVSSLQHWIQHHVTLQTDKFSYDCLQPMWKILLTMLGKKKGRSNKIEMEKVAVFQICLKLNYIISDL